MKICEGYKPILECKGLQLVTSCARPVKAYILRKICPEPAASIPAGWNFAKFWKSSQFLPSKPIFRKNYIFSHKVYIIYMAERPGYQSRRTISPATTPYGDFLLLLAPFAYGPHFSRNLGITYLQKSFISEPFPMNIKPLSFDSPYKILSFDLKNFPLVLFTAIKRNFYMARFCYF